MHQTTDNIAGTSVWLYVWILALIPLGCSSTEVPPATREGVIPGEGTREKALWKEAREQVLRIKQSGLLWKDPLVRDYLREVMNRVVPPEIRQKNFSFRVYVIKNPDPNAFAFPDGTIFIHTGLLARLENEAQLAMIIAHEAVHATHRHILEHRRNIKNKLAGLRWFGILTAPFGRVGRLGYVLGRLGTVAAVYGFSRDLEREADKTGFKFLLESGYDVREAPELFRLLNLQLDKDRDQPPYLYATHPRNRERRQYLKTLANNAEPTAGSRLGKKRYLNRMQEIIIWNARKNIERFWPETARFELNRILEHAPDRSRVYFLLAKTYFNSENQKLEKALKHLNKVVRKEDKSTDILLLKGRIFVLQQKFDLAREAFIQYLEEAPNSPRRWMIREMIEQLSRQTPENQAR